MERKPTTTLGLCLLVVALIVLAAAPAASAGAAVVRWTALETFAEPPNIVDGAPADSVMHGTYRSYGADGSVWRGTWAGTMDMRTYAMDFVSWGRCVSGPYHGYVLSQHGRSAGSGAPTVQSYTAFRLGWCWLK